MACLSQINDLTNLVNDSRLRGVISSPATPTTPTPSTVATRQLAGDSVGGYSEAAGDGGCAAGLGVSDDVVLPVSSLLDIMSEIRRGLTNVLVSILSRVFIMIVHTRQYSS